jgi:hypothetical protein
LLDARCWHPQRGLPVTSSMTQGAAYGGKDQALINIRPRLPSIKLDHRSRRFLVAPSIRLGSPAQQRSKPVPTTVFFASNRILTGDPVSSQAMVPISRPPIIAPIRPQRQALLTERLRSSPNRCSCIAGSHAGRKIDRRLDVSRRQMGSAA